MTSQSARRIKRGFECEGCGGTVPETRYFPEIRYGPYGNSEGGYLCRGCHPAWHRYGRPVR